MRRGTPSIRDVAAAAGVTPGTVSQVLNDNFQVRITSATRERVRAAAESLGYRPNALARALVRRRTQTIGLMVAGFRNPFFVELVEALEEATFRAGYSAMLDGAPSDRGTFQEHGHLRDWPVDGIIMWSMRGQRAEQYIANADRTQPVVYLSGEPLDGDVETVQADVRQGAADLARYLVRRGYRRPRYVPAYVQTDQEERTIAYRAVMQEAGLPLEIRPLEPEGERRTHAVDAGLRLATVRARERPDVVLCHNDVTAIGMIHGLRRGGLRIPEDIAVVGFDGTEEGQFLDRPLTTVRMPLAEMSERAVHRLRELIENPNLERSTQVFATGLVIGETA